MEKIFLAADLGAGSGRVIAGFFDGEKLRTETISRFANSPVSIRGHIHWNILALLSGVVEGIREAVTKYGAISSIGIDAWGVDYALLDASGRLLGLPYAYRDKRNEGLADIVADRLGRRRLYDRTGIQFLDINTLCQLEAESGESGSLLDKASRLLFIPDLLNYWLSGVAVCEATVASTSQCIDLKTGDWALDILEGVGAPGRLFGPIVRPGHKIGEVRGIEGCDALLASVGSHDTASAVAATPLPRSGKHGYLATGTWALMGVETETPIVSDVAYQHNFTHEGGVSGNFRFLKNITGMWIYQELRREFVERGDNLSFDELTALAANAPRFKSLIDPDATQFGQPGGMVEKIIDYCERTGQPAPKDKGAFARCALESMIMRYRQVWKNLEETTQTQRDGLNIIGGACRNALHCQMTADALGIPVTCGPVEGAAAGNIIAQLVASKDITSFEEGRELIRRSELLTEYHPSSEKASWDDAYARWLAIKERAEQPS